MHQLLICKHTEPPHSQPLHYRKVFGSILIRLGVHWVAFESVFVRPYLLIPARMSAHVGHSRLVSAPICASRPLSAHFWLYRLLPIRGVGNLLHMGRKCLHSWIAAMFPEVVLCFCCLAWIQASRGRQQLLNSRSYPYRKQPASHHGTTLVHEASSVFGGVRQRFIISQFMSICEQPPGARPQLPRISFGAHTVILRFARESQVFRTFLHGACVPFQ